MKNILLSAFFAVAAAVLCGCMNDTPADGLMEAKIEVLNNRDYARKVTELLESSTASVYLVLYVMKYDGDGVDHAANRMIRSLVGARKRGEDVRVLLDRVTAQSYPETTNYLAREGVNYRISPPGVTTHTKLMVIDGCVTVVGSHNWTWSAASENNEASVVLYSGEAARIERDYFFGLYEQAR